MFKNTRLSAVLAAVLFSISAVAFADVPDTAQGFVVVFCGFSRYKKRLVFGESRHEFFA